MVSLINFCKATRVPGLPIRPISLPLVVITTVGIDIMLNFAANPGLASTSTVRCVYSLCSTQDIAKTGANRVQGPHQVAPKSITTVS